MTFRRLESFFASQLSVQVRERAGRSLHEMIYVRSERDALETLPHSLLGLGHGKGVVTCQFT